MITFEDSADPKYIDVDLAAQLVNRKQRTIYEWIKFESVRTLKRPNMAVLVHMDDIRKIDGERAHGRRRKPRPPWERLAGRDA
ncbi:histidinol dehydrogenase [Leifsonia xyli subsp. cynodontis DSM 46306]|uniref:Helix-turn-helix domain-containing protein n=1 Tax=Leifsonia xyli subsp. cynodontis DSM 46306 TaxID=1389489 RepID=U3P8U1_LEIXC|nr:hypothetical protein [Leifsonia xyli]AGW41728.1 histidinol dehydrogenase [Leifsonia xyli subsp. cynodontis DSM 46306]AGW42251.1 histidinol dehydrogenase [Leifsonia xyli subsp. cynodontis DSM 46306]